MLQADGIVESRWRHWKVYRQQWVCVQLNDVDQVFPRGHRLRLLLSTSYWPLAWAPPEDVRLTLFDKGSALHLPVRPSRDEDDRLPGFAEPEVAASIDIKGTQDVHHRVRQAVNRMGHNPGTADNQVRRLDEARREKG
ncbi:CocE/NonD family hydrolase C-terminal non-catalytic domain-containing protein [Halomonas tibetensis]|uniref:CocE/NonD family hydrolase C-terminal non-catalytic domain-containing protein n=1 Tax=Halomonas tibetensis TaxID=2259590 RepID=A0ABV7B2U2_9GAMM